MSSVSLPLSIPLDDDGFIELECDFCKDRFMLSKDTFESDENISFYCPICGLPNRINTFYTTDVLERARQQAQNYMIDEINKRFSGLSKKINRSGVIKLKMNNPKHIQESELYKPAIEYYKNKMACCNVLVKATNYDNEIGLYCPICGRTSL